MSSHCEQRSKQANSQSSFKDLTRQFGRIMKQDKGYVQNHALFTYTFTHLFTLYLDPFYLSVQILSVKLTLYVPSKIPTME